jgi:hypothetical protein
MHLSVFSRLGSLPQSLYFRQDVNYGINLKRQSKACLEQIQLMVLSSDCSKGILRDSGFVQHGAQPERGYNVVLFFSFPRPVSFTLGIAIGSP